MLCCLIPILFFHIQREKKNVYNKKFCSFTCYCWLCHTAGSQFPFQKGVNPGSAVKDLPADAGETGDTCSVPGWERTPRGGKGSPSPVFPGGGNGNPLQCSSLDNPIARGAWQATAPGAAKSQTLPSLHTCMHGSESPRPNPQDQGILIYFRGKKFLISKEESFMQSYVQSCSRKHLPTSTSRGRRETQFVLFANFHGMNSPTND